MKHLKRASLTVFSSIALAAVSVSGVAQAQSGRVTIATGPAGTSYNQIATTVSNLLQQKLGVVSTARAFGGTTVYLPQLHRGQVDLGMNSALDTNAAYLGEEPYPQAMTNLRAGMVLFRAPYQLHARADSGIKSIGDLKGKRVVTEYRGVASFGLVNRVLLQTANLSVDDVEPVEVASVPEGIRGLTEGRIAATGSIPNIGLRREADASISGGIRVLQLGENEQALEQLAGFSATTMEPRPGAVGVDGPTRIVQFDVYLNTSSQHSAEDVYRQVKAIHQNWGELQEASIFLRGMDASDAVPLNMSHPYHEGAIRYFKQAGLWTEKHESRQQELLK